MIIPEDFRKDRYTLEPIIKEMMTAVGKQKAKVVVCTDPLLGGIDQALRWERIKEIIDDYKHKVQLFLLCVDRDGKAERRARIDYLEEQASSILNQNQRFLGENAWQEIEVWVLAGHDLPDAWSWSEIRQEINPKETYFVPFISTVVFKINLAEAERHLQKKPHGDIIASGNFALKMWQIWRVGFPPGLKPSPASRRRLRPYVSMVSILSTVIN